MLVRDTVDKIAKDPTKDVVVHVYQPEDGESEAFTTDFENLAIAFENVTSVVLAKFNALENEHEDIDFTFDVRIYAACHARLSVSVYLYVCT